MSYSETRSLILVSLRLLEGSVLLLGDYNATTNKLSNYCSVISNLWPDTDNKVGQYQLIQLADQNIGQALLFSL